MKSLILAGCLLGSACLATPALAWFSTGHQVAASIAYSNLSPAARARVDTILQADPRHRDFLSASTWPDDIRSPTSGIPRGEQHGNWHFDNIPFARSSDPPYEPAGESVVTQIPVEAAILADPDVTPETKADALAWVEHLVGDIHQPLHCSTHITPDHPAPRGDRGGNDFKLSGRLDRLHSFWDGALTLPPTDTDVPTLSAHLQAEYPIREFRKQLAVVNPEEWAVESFRLAEQYAYDLSPENPATPPTPSSRYCRTARAVCRRQITLAGYRLAALLNRTLGQ